MIVILQFAIIIDGVNASRGECSFVTVRLVISRVYENTISHDANHNTSPRSLRQDVKGLEQYKKIKSKAP